MTSCTVKTTIDRMGRAIFPMSSGGMYEKGKRKGGQEVKKSRKRKLNGKRNVKGIKY
jgi:hypothetical protein